MALVITSGLRLRRLGHLGRMSLSHLGGHLGRVSSRGGSLGASTVGISSADLLDSRKNLVYESVLLVMVVFHVKL